MVTVVVPMVANPVVTIVAPVAMTYNYDSAVRGTNHPGVPVMMMIVPVTILGVAFKGKSRTDEQAQRYN